MQRPFGNLFLDAYAEQRFSRTLVSLLVTYIQMYVYMCEYNIYIFNLAIFKFLLIIQFWFSSQSLFWKKKTLVIYAFGIDFVEEQDLATGKET